MNKQAHVVFYELLRHPDRAFVRHVRVLRAAEESHSAATSHSTAPETSPSVRRGCVWIIIIVIIVIVIIIVNVIIITLLLLCTYWTMIVGGYEEVTFSSAIKGTKCSFWECGSHLIHSQSSVHSNHVSIIQKCFRTRHPPVTLLGQLPLQISWYFNGDAPLEVK